MAGERGGHSLQATALVNEAYLRLVDVQHVDWQNRAHFLAMSARLMRQILVDIARSKAYLKRGGGAVKVTFDEVLIMQGEPGQDLVALDDALQLLTSVDARKAKVIELRFFGGLSVEETASVLDVSVDTVMRDWKLAKAWLLRELRDQTGKKGPTMAPTSKTVPQAVPAPRALQSSGFFTRSDRKRVRSRSKCPSPGCRSTTTFPQSTEAS